MLTGGMPLYPVDGDRIGRLGTDNSNFLTKCKCRGGGRDDGIRPYAERRLRRGSSNECVFTLIGEAFEQSQDRQRSQRSGKRLVLGMN
jgi:hypothetical protein